ncbi:MAG: YbaN family protein [Candidatus Thiodiazotropha sp.]
MNQSNYSSDLATSLNITRGSASLQEAKSDSPNHLMCLWGGHTLTGLGFIGILLPLMPTTVFWIGAAICYARSSPDLYQKLVNHECYGKAIQDYIEHGVVSRPGKLAALLGMSFSAALIWLAPVNDFMTLGAILGLGVAATYVVTRPSKVFDE